MCIEAIPACRPFLRRLKSTLSVRCSGIVARLYHSQSFSRRVAIATLTAMANGGAVATAGKPRAALLSTAPLTRLRRGDCGDGA